MKIIDLLKKDAIALNVSLTDKEEAIDKLISLHEKAGNLADKAAYKEAILAREAQGSTAIGEGIAVPHAKSDSVKTPGLSAITVPNGVDYGAPDSKPSDILFMIAAPVDGDLHLEILSRLMVMLMEPEFCAALRGAKTTDEFLEIIDKKEAEKYPEEAVKPEVKPKGYRILAVTACPTGIAHTYMAAEALEKAGEKLGYPLKAETNGSGGAKNVLTKKEIEECDGIIIAADKNVEMARFDGKPVVKTSVSNGINKPEELIKRVVDGKAAIYHADESEKQPIDDDEKESGWHKLYKHLMNGVSHMLPFVVGGGVLIALGFLFDTLAGNADVGGTFGFTSPVAAIVFWIGKAAFALMLPILSAYIASSVADRPGLLPGMIGGVFAANGYTFSSLIENQSLTGDDKAVSGFLGARRLPCRYYCKSPQKGIFLASEINGRNKARIYLSSFRHAYHGPSYVSCKPRYRRCQLRSFLVPLVARRYKQNTPFHSTCGNDGNGYGRPVQQGGLCFRHGCNSRRQHMDYGGCYDRRYGSPDCNRTFDNLQQEEVDIGRNQIRPRKLSYGSVLHYGGCYPLRRFRPGQSYPLMLSRLCCRRCSYITVQRYMPRTSRRNLHIYSMRPSASLYRSPYCRLGCRSADARSS